MPSETNLRAGWLKCFAQKKLDELLEQVPRPHRRRLLHDSALWGRSAQFEPESENWRLWLVLGGRGAGKSRTGAEWIKRRIRYAPTPLRVALLGPSLQEARSVMVEGESGLLSVHAHDEEPPLFLPTKREMIFPNGSIAQLLSADSPESLRGPQFHLAWCDELAKWRYRDEAWNMLQFALRLGERPQQIVTTTPKPSALLKRLIEDEQTVLTRTRALTHCRPAR
jgi:phage terminase large subunit-like protein